MIVETFIKNFIPLAERAGIGRLRFYVEKIEEITVTVFEGDPENIEISILERIFIEGEWQNKVGSAYTEILAASAYDEIIRTICQTAECGEKVWQYCDLKPIELLPVQNQTFKDSEVILSDLLKAEKLAIECDPRIVNVSECRYESNHRTVLLTDGKVSLQDDCGVAEIFMLKVTAKEGEKVQSCYRRFLMGDLDTFKKYVEQTVKSAVEMLGAQMVPTAHYAVILQNTVVSELLEAYIPAFYMENVNSGMSCLCGKLDHKIGSDAVSLFEVPLMEGTGLKRRFDDEGVQTQFKTLMNSGVLKIFLRNEHSLKDGKSTGNGFKLLYKQPVTTGTTNLVLKKGNFSKLDLIKTLNEGLIITDIAGTFAGAKYASGEFVLIAKGFQVKAGRIVGGVHQITIAGDFVKMLQAVRAVGNDPFTLYEGNRTITAPSLLLDQLKISGT
ncbi:TldD/PmbA family protein [Fusibacter sp. 3D3]|uniref:TldD/PmbA family protein n=1 Tax=Fusibacter sp. 3D3 TaxID=1048380 RepID=UPI00085369B5|nr:metallopeptidase TldD-related protein [Fusibacter sp. 3D3]GAU79248.1 TldE protein, part of TldE/TldD proteolytic complex [Fusibacter sp. 3D3]